jgi:hypothetical protein
MIAWEKCTFPGCRGRFDPGLETEETRCCTEGCVLPKAPHPELAGRTDEILGEWKRPAPLASQGTEEPARRRQSQADQLVEIAAAGELFHDSAGDTYASLQVGDHRETWATRSKGFKRWLGREFYERQRKASGGQAMADALAVIEARAQFDGPCRTVHVRVAPDGRGGIFLDLGDASWAAVHITPDGWKVDPQPSVRFRRPPGLLPLPAPTAGGSLNELRRFANVRDERAWALIKAWLRAAVCDRGPYPILELSGEQGSAKTTLGRMLRSLIDPARPELRSDPRELRDLAIAARQTWIVAFDNVSHLPPWLSDALCRLSTGGGWATRELYSNDEEVLFEATRPVLLTGIVSPATRPDVLDRTVQVTLSPIGEENRRDERALWAEFDQARSRLLGALLSDVSAALQELSSTVLKSKPRMADFALWAVAAERGRGEPQRFLEAYRTARNEGWEQAIDGSAIGPTLLTFAECQLPWEGTTSTLLDILNSLADEQLRRGKFWPRNGRALSGELRRLAPALRATGLGITFRRSTGGPRHVILEKQAGRPSLPSLPSLPRTNAPGSSDANGAPGDGSDGTSDGQSRTSDGSDGPAGAFSGVGQPPVPADPDSDNGRSRAEMDSAATSSLYAAESISGDQGGSCLKCGRTSPNGLTPCNWCVAGVRR